MSSAEATVCATHKAGTEVEALAGTHVAVVDTESTGIEPTDEPISIGIVLAKVDEKGHGEPIAEWYGEQHPSVPIHPEAHKVHGRTAESLQGRVFDLDGLRTFLDRADVLVAHNSRFDAQMLEKVIPGVSRRNWRCSLRQWSWPTLGSRKLDAVCAHFGIARPEVHDALADARALFQALMQRTGKTERSRTYLHKLLSQPAFDVSRRPSRAAPRPQPQKPTETPGHGWIYIVGVLLLLVVTLRACGA